MGEISVAGRGAGAGLHRPAGAAGLQSLFGINAHERVGDIDDAVSPEHIVSSQGPFLTERGGNLWKFALHQGCRNVPGPSAARFEFDRIFPSAWLAEHFI